MPAFIVEVYEVHVSRRVVIAEHSIAAKDIAPSEGTEIACSYYKMLSDYTHDIEDDTDLVGRLTATDLDELSDLLDDSQLQELKDNI